MILSGLYLLIWWPKDRLGDGDVPVAWLECLRPKDPSEKAAARSPHSHTGLPGHGASGPMSPLSSSSTMRAADEKTPLWGGYGDERP